MSFIAILVALLLEQARPVGRGNSVHATVRGWASWVGRNFDAGQAHHGWLAWGLTVVVPSLLVLFVYWILVTTAGWPYGVVWNVVVLYLTLGFRQFSHHFTEIRDALEDDDEARARSLLAQWRQSSVGDLPRGEIVRQVIEHSVIAAHRHVFGVLAWFSVLAVMGLGPVGAVAYRLSEFVPRYWARENASRVRPVSAPAQNAARQAWHIIDWVPARITAMGFAVVGSFEDAIDSWRNYERHAWVDNDGVILASTSGAINLQLKTHVEPMLAAPGPGGDAELSPADAPDAGVAPEVGHLRIVVGLVWRTVVMWMILLALLTLARLLG